MSTQVFFHIHLTFPLSSLFKQQGGWPPTQWKLHWLSLTLCLCLLVVNNTTKAPSLGFPPSFAAVRFSRFLHLIPHIPLSISCLSFYSKPVMWAPRSSCRGPSRDRGRWCWTWRWLRSTTSSTSEEAPSSVWRYLSRSIRSELLQMNCILPENQAALICSWWFVWDSSPFFFLFICF